MENGNTVLDPRALAVFRAYLDVYSFPCNVHGAEQELRDKRGPRACFPWPLDELRNFHDDPLTARIGIPQGGALSCVILNVLLHRADVSVEQFRVEGNDLLYLRFCDDVIFLSPSREVTARALEIYCEQLALLKLPVYSPKSLPVYRGQGETSLKLSSVIPVSDVRSQTFEARLLIDSKVVKDFQVG